MSTCSPRRSARRSKSPRIAERMSSRWLSSRTADHSRPYRRLLQVRVSEARRTSRSRRPRRRRRGDRAPAPGRRRRLGNSGRARSHDAAVTEATPSRRHGPTPAPRFPRRGSHRRSRTGSRPRVRLRSRRYRTACARTDHRTRLLALQRGSALQGGTLREPAAPVLDAGPVDETADRAGLHGGSSRRIIRRVARAGWSKVRTPRPARSVGPSHDEEGRHGGQDRRRHDEADRCCRSRRGHGSHRAPKPIDGSLP